MGKYMNIIYFVFAAFILYFGVSTLIAGEGKLWANICIVLIGLYFLYRGIAVTVNNSRRKERERLADEDRNNDPANS
jgi:4-hydroxybenzoate polyprenyltransferase